MANRQVDRGALVVVREVSLKDIKGLEREEVDSSDGAILGENEGSWLSTIFREAEIADVHLEVDAIGFELFVDETDGASVDGSCSKLLALNALVVFLDKIQRLGHDLPKGLQATVGERVFISYNPFGI